MRENWQVFKLAQLYDISSGLSKSADEFGFGFPFLSFSNVFRNYFVPSELSQLVNTSKQEQVKCSVKKGDVFLTRTSETIEELGMSSVALKDYPNATFNGFTKRLRPKNDKDVYPKFIGYYLRSVFFRAEITAYSTLTTRASLNNGIIERLKINLPPLQTQKKIANILSAYDDLIENNNQRIQLLEDMAAEIYKEWFVRLRFPGYQACRYFDKNGAEVERGVDGALPEGWEKKSFEDVADYINGYAFKPSDWGKMGLPIIKIAELKNGLMNKTPYNEGTKIPKKFHISQGELLFSWSADLNVYLWNYGNGILNQHIFKVVPYPIISKEYLFFALKRQMPIFRNMSNGATMHHIKRSELGRVYLNLPKENILNSFTKITNPLLKEIGILKSKNQLLQSTRDLLLPRLISGKLSVANMEGGI